MPFRPHDCKRPSRQQQQPRRPHAVKAEAARRSSRAAAKAAQPMAYYPFVYATDEEGTPSDDVNDAEEATELIDCGLLTDETMIWSDDHPMEGWTEWLRCKGGFGFEGEDADGDGVVDDNVTRAGQHGLGRL